MFWHSKVDAATISARPQSDTVGHVRTSHGVWGVRIVLSLHHLESQVRQPRHLLDRAMIHCAKVIRARPHYAQDRRYKQRPIHCRADPGRFGCAIARTKVGIGICEVDVRAR